MCFTYASDKKFVHEVTTKISQWGNASASGFSVNFVKVYEKSGYQAAKWIRYKRDITITN